MVFVVVFIIGLLASCLGALLGLGGGFIIVPLLTLVLHFNIKNAIFFSLCSIVLLSFLQNFRHRHLLRQHNKFVLSFCLPVIAGSFVMALIGAHTSPVVLQFLFSILLIVMGGIYWREVALNAISIPKLSPQMAAQILLFAASAMGGLLGIGGGIINVPVLNKLCRRTMLEAARLSLVFVFFSSSVALVVIFNQRRNEIVELSLFTLSALLVGTVAGSFLSSHLKVSDSGLKKVFSLVLVFLGIIKLIKIFY